MNRFQKYYLYSKMWMRRNIQYGYNCPKCDSWFADDFKSHPNGILCPECHERNHFLVGVLRKKRLPWYYLKNRTLTS